MYQPKTITSKDMIGDGAYPVYGANGVIGRYDKFNHETPQLLITCRGATCGTVNVSAPHSWITGNAMVVRPKDASIDLRFLEFVFRGGVDIQKAITGAAQPQITRTNLEQIQISYPTSLAEQHRIVDILSRAEGIVRLRREAEKKAAELIPALFLDMFGDPATNPKGWPVHLLKDLVSFMSGGTPSKSREDFWQGDLPWVSPKDMKQAYIAEAIDHVNRKVLAETNIKLVPIGSLLIVVRGMILVHTVPIAQSLIEHTINQDMKALFPVAKINVGYLLWLMKVSQPQLLGLVTTAAHGTKKLDTERLENFRIPVPPLEIQVSFAEKVARIESIQSQQSAATAKAQATFDALLAQVFS